jgi:chromosome partitioning protein
MIITVGATKGGAGKSTVALHLAASSAQRGRNVWVIDGDRQMTIQTALTYRGEAAVPQISVAAYAEGATLRKQVLHQASRYDDVIIDVGGRDSTALRAALSVTDIFLLPFVPRSFDVWATPDMAALIDEAIAGGRDGLKAFAFLNRADPSSPGDNQAAKDVFAEYPQITLLKSTLGNRKVFADAAGDGLSVSEWKPKNNKAIKELEELISELGIFDGD